MDGSDDEHETDGESERPSVARIYDRLLGGAHNFAADRSLSDEISTTYPLAARWTWANRRFLRRSVEYCLTLGIDRFVDLGSGIPTDGNVHEIARRVRPAARVAYVDHESVAVAHTRTTIDGLEGVTITQADLRRADEVLDAPGLVELLDAGRPVALLAMAVLHCVADADDPTGVLARYRARLPAGSVLALSHTSSDLPDHPEIARAHRDVLRLYADTDAPLYGRSRAEIRAMVEGAGFVVNPDGLVELGHWAPSGHPPGEPLGGYTLVTEPSG